MKPRKTYGLLSMFLKKRFNMLLSNSAIKKFKKLYLKEYGRKLTNEQANELGIKLLNLFKLIYKPITTRV